MESLPGGVWPVMLTPFDDDGILDMDALDVLTDWYIERGVSGLFAVCLSSEMYHLSDDERIDVATQVVRRAAGRVPVIATGTFGGPVPEQAEMVKRMHDTGVKATVVITAQLAEKQEFADVWMKNLNQLLDLTGDVPLGFYECPRPYHRVLAPGTLKQCAETGRFYFIKETSAMRDLVKAKIEATKGTTLGIYDACDTTLMSALENGAAGYCGVAANAYPELFVWLCRNHASDPEKARRLHRFLAVVDRALVLSYPVGAKQYMQNVGLPVTTHCRTTEAQLNERDLLTLENLRGLVEEWWEELSLDFGERETRGPGA